jgi:prepilin-type N-terminal cleavage/methylation domain-containing protein
MKNKGFTLIELLAVLVLLAVISVITIPNVLTSLNNTKEQTLLRSADNLIKTAELKFLDSIFQGYHSTYEEGILTSGEELSFKGKTPDYLAINVNDEGRVSIAMWDNSINKCVVKGYNDNETRFEAAADYVECMSYAGTTIVVLFTQVTDTNPGVICSATETEDYANNSTCYVRSIEDLVQLSELAKTNNFSTKTIYLEANLDFENDLSYVNPNTTVFGDINGNSIIEPLKTELTTSAGFLPIGSSFRGTFFGNAKIIKNLYISRNINNVGLFSSPYYATINNLILDNSYISGSNYVGTLAGNAGYGTSISGIISKNVTVIGTTYVGGLIGYVPGTSTVATTITTGNVTGVSYVGGSLGYLYGSTSYSAVFKDAIFSGNVVGDSRVGGVVGEKTATWSHVTNIAMTGGSVTATSLFGRVIGVNTPTNAAANKDILVNGITVNGTSLTDKNGKDVDAASFDDINLYETLGMDTYINGDESSNGSYFDYDDLNNIVVKYDPISITMAGTGVLGDPYLIYDYDDLRESSSNRAAHYRLMSDIDLSGNPFYMLGSSTNAFSGVFDGNGQTISNFTIRGANNVGMFGTNIGTVQNLSINNIDVYGLDNVGTVAGYNYNSGIIRGINITNMTVNAENNVGGVVGLVSYPSTTDLVRVSGNVTGISYVGGAAGQMSGMSSYSTIVRNIIYTGDVVGSTNVGGVVGAKTASYTTVANIAMTGGSVTATSLFGRVIGVNTPTNAAANKDILVNGITVNGTSLTDKNGKDVDAASFDDINLYETLGMDTYINGDESSNGSYFDYDDLNNIVVKYDPISITMAGTGVLGDPYLIYDYDDLRESSSNRAAHYRLMSDIDLSGNPFYMLGSSTNAFSGVFDGNGQTISNFTIRGANNVGMFGTNIGTVQNLSINNIDVYGLDNVGTVAGYNYNSGIIRGINITNMTVNAENNVGGVVGLVSYPSTTDLVRVSGNVTGISYVGGAAGQMSGMSSYSTIVRNIIYTGDVVGSTNVGGVVGAKTASYTTVANIAMTGGSVTATSLFGRVIGVNTPTNAIANSAILVNEVTVSSSLTTSIHGQDKTAAELLLQNTYTTVGFNFTDTTPGTYIWRISGSDIWVERN